MNLWGKYKKISAGSPRIMAKVVSVEVDGGRCLVEELSGGQYIVTAGDVSADDVVFVESGRVESITDIDFDNVVDLAILT